MTISITNMGSGVSLKDLIAAGYVFEVAETIDIPNAGGVGEALFVTGDKAVKIYQRAVTTNGDEMTYQAFVGTTVSANGTELTPTSRNGVLVKQPTTKVYESPTVTADGIPLQPVYMAGATGQGNRTIGQFDIDGQIRIIPPNTVALARVTNNGAANPAKTQIYLLWGEVDSEI